MIDKTISMYVFFDDVLKSINHIEPESRKTTDSEAITVVLIVAQYFGGNIEKAINFVRSTGLMPQMLGKSRFNRSNDTDIRLLVNRKSNSKRPHQPHIEYFISKTRKRIETVFSDIAKYFPKTIHAVTANGFLIKLMAFIWAYTFDKLYVAT